ncbi:unnamed protein product [Citrullus colocynthis]|uniref:Uncharacterized protein n=1 Tax=Citrullus colocynthis TaxID=252529 RepID=A0ABP0XWY8_9ROSI
MVLNGFDSVKALKAIAIVNYSRRRKLKWLFEFFVFLFLVSSRSTLLSLASPVLHHIFRQLLVVLNSHIFVFVVFHAMLFVVYSLSHLTDNKSGSNLPDAESGRDGDLPESLVAPIDDSIAEILVVREMTPVIGDSIAEPPAEKKTTDLVIAAAEETTTELAISAAEEMTTAPLSPVSPVRHLNAVMETAEIIPDTKRYRRTESERFEENRETSKFRRSKTEISRREPGGELKRFLNSVDEMDIDDFNRTVESFIAEQKMHIGGRVSG